MASLNQLLLSVLLFLSFISIAVLAYTRKSADVGNRLQGQHSITAWKSQTIDGFLYCRTLRPTVSSPSALFTAVGDSSSAEKSKYPDTSPLKYSDFHVVTRTQSNDEIRHLELYLKWRKGGSWWAFAIRFLPQFLRPKPSAKTGVRTYISSSIMMDNLVMKYFGESALEKLSYKLQEEPDANSKSGQEKSVSASISDVANNRVKSTNDKIKKVGPTSTGSANTKWAAKTDKDSIAIVGLFVYMWIAPMLRKRQLGDVLFEKGKQMCRDLGAGFMILVHDDDGSGKLIKYYEDRNFEPIFDVIDKGMLGQL